MQKKNRQKCVPVQTTPYTYRHSLIDHCLPVCTHFDLENLPHILYIGER